MPKLSYVCLIHNHNIGVSALQAIEGLPENISQLSIYSHEVGINKFENILAGYKSFMILSAVYCQANIFGAIDVIISSSRFCSLNID